MTPTGSLIDIPKAPGLSRGMVSPVSRLGTPAAARNALMQYSTSNWAFITGEPTSSISKSRYSWRSRSTKAAASQRIFLSLLPASFCNYEMPSGPLPRLD